MGRKYLPQTDAGLLAWTEQFNSNISTKYAEVGLSQAQATAYDAANSEWRAKLNASTNPLTRGTSTILAKNLFKKEIVALSREYARIVQSFPGTTDQQRSDLGLTVRKMPAPIPAPEVAPDLDVRGVTGRTVKVRIHNADTLGTRAKPEGVTAAWIYSFVGESYPSDPGEWEFQGATSNGEFDAVFPDSVAGGSQVWICAAWVNAKQQAGPVCTPIPTNLQGGGTSAATAELKIAA